MKRTAKDVALRAGTSVSAVSRAFKPGSALSDDKRKRILEAATELGYATPSGQVASRVNLGTIALVAGDLANPFYPTVLEALSQELFKRERRLILHVAPAGRDVDAVMQQVLDYKVDAAIITSATLSSTLARTCTQRKLPVVLFNRAQPEAGISAVSCDNFAGGRAIGERIVESGRRRIAFVGGLEDTSTHIERWRGFSEALNHAGIPLFAQVSGAFDYGKAFQAVSDLLREGVKPETIFCCNDVMALAAIDAAKACGMQVPGDLAVIGFDDIPMAAWQSYRLTTVRQRIRLMIKECIELIDLIMSDPEHAGTTRLVPGYLIERDSG
ncbi:substrate-binding domain-containing protein [Denitrobaculum tricleocarpae]|nr:substrate-binding domain-containing protein [Denitrobaculum tricleocarpae]